MKKLLSLLSVLTISGSAVPTTIAASPYQKEEKNSKILNKIKRDVGASDCESGWEKSYCSFSPELWEEITMVMNQNPSNNYNFSNNHKIMFDLISKKMEKFNVEGWNNSRVIETIIFSFNILDNEWQKSDKKHHIRIVSDTDVCNASISTCEPRTHFESVNIREDWDIKSNKYLSKLENDLKVFNLNLIDNEKDETILNAIKNKNPNLDISQIEIVSKKSYPNLSKGFSVKVKVKNGSETYSNGIIKNSFTFNTKDNLNKINEIIKNDSKTITWINHLQDWANDVESEFKLTVPQKTNAQKFEWKNRKKEDLKTYIRDWIFVLELIDVKLKLHELYTTYEEIKTDIDNLKLKINEINEKISSNNNLTNCSNIGGLISPIAALIPGVGALISAISGTASAICTIANA